MRWLGVLTAASAVEGLVAAEVEQPDAILLDMVMPDLDGRATLGKLKANEATCRIPTILLTAEVNSSELQPFSDLNVAGVIAKPFEVLKLAAQIQGLLNW